MKRFNDIPIKIGFYLESVLWYENANRINMEIQELLKSIGNYGSLICFTNLQLTTEDAAKLIAYFNKNNIKCSDIFCISENKLCSEKYNGNGMSNWIECDVILNAKSGLTQTFNTLKSFVDLNENTENVNISLICFFLL